MSSLSAGTGAAAPPASTVTIDADGDTGQDSSMVLDAAGHPVIAYHDATHRDLRLVRCDDPACVGEETPITIDAVGDTGHNPSLRLDAVGNPVIAYTEFTGSQDGIGPLRVVRCDDPKCVAGASPVTIDAGGAPAVFSSLVLDAVGNPIIAYTSGLIGAGLRVVHCDDPACAGVEEPVIVDPVGKGAPSMRLDADGNPVIVYRGGSSGQAEMHLVRCTDRSCVTTPASVRLTGGDSGGFSLTLDAADNPVIAYTGFVEIILVRCADPSCTGDVTYARVDQGGCCTNDRSMALDAAGNPVIAYIDYTQRAGSPLVLLRCDDPGCAGDEARVVLDATSSRGASSLVLDDAGRPLISHYDGVNGDLRLARCAEPGCVDLTGPTATIGLGAGQDAEADAAPVVFDVTFDEPLMGFTGAEVNVTGTAGATRATVSGDGPTYMVTVDKVRDDGTVVIDIAAGAVTDLAGNDSQASVLISNTVTIRSSLTTTDTTPEPTGVLPETGSDRLISTIAALFVAGGLSLLAVVRRRAA